MGGGAPRFTASARAPGLFGARFGALSGGRGRQPLSIRPRARDLEAEWSTHLLAFPRELMGSAEVHGVRACPQSPS